MADRPTYDELFDLLSQLGFIKADPNPWEWVFWHERSDTVLLFSLQGDENTAQPVREADLTSAETHLRGRGLIDRSLAELLGSESRATESRR
jgi:hypothetical protein